MRITFFIVVLKYAQVRTDDEMEGRVVNGRLARIQRHPHSAHLVMSEPYTQGTWVCGASIVNQRVLLTAAHCFEQTTKKGIITANVGSTHLDKGKKFSVTSLKVHPEYDAESIINDIALVGLDKSIVFGLKAKRIVIAKHKRTEGMAKLAGWGAVQVTPEEYYVSSYYLHEVSVPFMSREKCAHILHGHMDIGKFCGGKFNATFFPSVGDSGSPLVVKNYLQIGLVSYKDDKISRSMVIYTDVTYFYNWITETAKTVFCKKDFDVLTLNNNGHNYGAAYSEDIVR